MNEGKQLGSAVVPMLAFLAVAVFCPLPTPWAQLIAGVAVGLALLVLLAVLAGFIIRRVM